MSHSELSDELNAIEAIYPGSTEILAPGIVVLTVPEHEDLSFQLAFPESYPLEAPSVIQVSTTNVRKFPDVNYVESKINNIIKDVFMEEMVIIFELLGELQLFLEEHEKEHVREVEAMAKEMEQVKIEHRKEKLAETAKRLESTGATEPLTRPLKECDYTAGWTQSEPIVDRNSTFIAFAREVSSVDEAHRLVEELTLDRKIAKATHNITSMRVKGANNTSFQDCDDDGETAAGSRMLHLMTVCLDFIWL